MMGVKRGLFVQSHSFALQNKKNYEQRNTQGKGYINKKLVFDTDLLYQATDSFYVLKQLFCYVWKKHNTTTTPKKPPNLTALQGQGSATFLQSHSNPEHKLIWRELSPEESALLLRGCPHPSPPGQHRAEVLHEKGQWLWRWWGCAGGHKAVCSPRLVQKGFLFGKNTEKNINSELER